MVIALISTVALSVLVIGLLLALIVRVLFFWFSDPEPEDGGDDGDDWRRGRTRRGLPGPPRPSGGGTSLTHPDAAMSPIRAPPRHQARPSPTGA
jgi:hypothetical protein